MNAAITRTALLLGLLLIGPQALPLDNENQGNLNTMNERLAVHNAALVLGLGSSGAIGSAIEITEMSANILLKTVPAVLEVPDNKFVFPNLGSNGDYRCTFAYTTPQVSASYNELLGLGVIKPLPEVWGDFGAPQIIHKNSSVKLTMGGLQNPSIGPNGVSGTFSEGDHTIRWFAETQYSPFWDGTFPALMLAYGVLSEAKYGKVFFEPLSKQASKKAARNQDKLIDVAKDIGIAAGVISAELISDELNLIGDEQTFARHARSQLFRVWDVHPPEFRDPSDDSTIETQTVAIEASDFGGARFNRIRDDLIKKFQLYDDCGRPMSLRVNNAPSLIPIGETGVELEWVIQDDGHYNIDTPLFDPAANQSFLPPDAGDTSPARFLKTTLRQRVIVRDEQPPLLFRPESFVREVTQNIVLNGDAAVIQEQLGRAIAIDLADPNPEIIKTVPAILEAPTAGEEGRRYFIEYEAVDESGNRTVATVDNPDQYTQIVTLKAPGKNTAPTAQPPLTTPTTVSDTAVRIRLAGLDPDPEINGITDPLVFSIVDQPAHGEFVAPLYPTFIEDYRSKPTATPGNENPQTLDCPLDNPQAGDPTLNEQLGLLDVTDHGDYIIKCYCSADAEPPRDFVYQPDYVHITDDGLNYVSDNPFVCNNQAGQPGAAKRQRLGTWNQGDLVNERLGSFANANANRTFDVDAQGHVWQLIIDGGAGTSASATVERYEPDLQITGRERNLTVDTNSNPFGGLSASAVVSSYADLDSGLLYVADKTRIVVFTLEGERNRAAIADLRSQTDFNGLSIDAPCNTLPGVNNSAKVGFTMQTDSKGNLYVADSCAHQVHKFLPTSLNLDGSVNVGQYEGWLGKCTGNKTDPASGVEFNSCVVADSVSNGFACTDETCSVDPFDRGGSAPGQFDVITHLNLDPNDTLYVADFTNQRIQRFGADGAFAGEAKSTGDGISSDSSFVLGNMGPPRHVSVNSNSFHVLESRPNVGDFFLHIFTTLPFTEVTSDGATVEYISDISFTGTDQFTFLVDDGLAASTAATVSIQVDPTQRPPTDLRSQCYADVELQNQTPCTLLEDTEIYIRLSSSDPDGFFGFGGRDSHNFSLESQPGLGELELLSSNNPVPNNVVYRYTPNSNANGEDQFNFQADDGVDSATEAGVVNLMIIPVADDVVLTFPEDLRVARGFEESVSIEFHDPDEDPNSLLRAQIFDWGDSVVAREDQSWVNIGVFDDDGNPVDPQRDTLPGQGLLVGAHVFDTNSTGYRITLQDGTSQVIATSGPIVAEEVTRVNVTKLDGPDLQPDTDTSVSLQVLNEQPQTWAGIQAGAVTVDIQIPADIELINYPTTAPTQCTRNGSATNLQCSLGNLNVGEPATIDLTLRVDLATARTKTLYAFRTSQTDIGPRLDATTESVFILEVADVDGDGVIDVDDAFPNNSSYSADSDGDGTADIWEIDHGFDPNNSADAATDLDMDGFNNRLEFELGGRPRLADAYLTSAQLNSDLPTPTNDRFGIALGSADIDGDSLADLVMGAPSYATSGAAFVHYGANAVDSQLLTRIDPAAGITDFGRSAAVGDLDGNGFADLAIGGANSLSIYLATASGLPAAPSRVILGTAGEGLGHAVVIADIDDDNALDLVYSAPTHSASTSSQGSVTVYRASSNWWQDPVSTPSKVFIGPDTANFRLGMSLAVADIDGDGLADLMAGSVLNNGEVYAYLGSSRDWSTLFRSNADLVIAGEASADQFGWSMTADGDVDDDGIKDLVIGAYGHGNTGAVYLFASRDSYWNQTEPVHSDKIFAGSTNDQFGVRVATLAPSGSKVGADILVGANRFEQGSTPDEGTFYLYNGGALPLGNPLQQLSDSGHDMLGYNLIGTKDINGDGNHDFVVGAPDISVTGYVADGGFVQLFYGGAAESQADTDTDGVADALDNCLNDVNLNQQDTDSDGSGDACDADIDGDSINNNIDNCPLIASANQSDFDNDGVGDVCDDDDDNDGTADADDAFPRDANYQQDSDNDGLPDSYETANGLNPNDANDANADLDGDGRNNIDEFLQGGDVAVDDIAPVLNIPADLVIDATGIQTPVDLGNATANDAKDGTLTPTADNLGPYLSGRHLVTWSASDAIGNLSTQVQTLDVRPLINFVGTSGQTSEGSQATLAIALSGAAPEYPVTVTLAVSGNADVDMDYESIADRVVIDASNQAMLDIQTLSDNAAEGTEEVLLTISSAVNGALGSNRVFAQQIVEGNILARGNILPTQSGEPRTTIFADQGSVQLQAQIADPNSADTHLLDWSGTDSALIASEGPGAPTFTFDPSGLNAGLYRIQLTLVDSGDPTQPVLVERWLKVVVTMPNLSANADSDGDGSSDVIEGFADADQDGVPDYLDPTDKTEHLRMRTTDTAVMQTQPGLLLALGSTAQATGTDATVTLADVVQFGSNGEPALNAIDDGFTYLADAADFVIHNLSQPGDTAQVVIPLGDTISAQASYRKYLTDLGWQGFELSGSDQLASAPGSATTCPAPGHAEYRAGLNEGDRCLQLTIADGGPNDADGLANGTILDPGGVAIPNGQPSITLTPLSVANKSVTTGETDVAMLRFRLTSNTGSTRLASIRLQASGTGEDNSDIRDVILWADLDGDGLVSTGDTPIGNGRYGADNGSLNITPTTDFNIPSGDSDYLVAYDY